MEKTRKEYIRDILNFLLTAGVIIIASQSPHFINSLIKRLFKNPKQSFKYLNRYFYDLKYQGFISIKRKNTKLEMKLTPKGIKKITNLNFWDLKLKKSKKWDKKWRVIIFDIPKRINRTREMFRLKLREFGFYQLQKSVWLYPYQCEKEIAYLRQMLGAEEYIKVIITDDIELDKRALKFFNFLSKK